MSDPHSAATAWAAVPHMPTRGAISESLPTDAKISSLPTNPQPNQRLLVSDWENLWLCFQSLFD